MAFITFQGKKAIDKDKQEKDNPDNYQKLGNVCWFTNLDHGKRHEPIRLMTMSENLTLNGEKLKAKNAYQQYDNYHAIEVPYTKAIPSDYEGVMGVPISFLDKYNPDQFEILGVDHQLNDGLLPELLKSEWQGKRDKGYINNKRMYSRILIKHKGAK